MGEKIGLLFNDDYAQYDSSKGFVDNVRVPNRILDQLMQSKSLSFTLVVPPGIGGVRVFTAVIAYAI